MSISWSISINILNRDYFFEKTADIIVEKSIKGISAVYFVAKKYICCFYRLEVLHLLVLIGIIILK
jgi:hypothetical protein